MSAEETDRNDTATKSAEDRSVETPPETQPETTREDLTPGAGSDSEVAEPAEPIERPDAVVDSAPETESVAVDESLASPEAQAAEAEASAADKPGPAPADSPGKAAPKAPPAEGPDHRWYIVHTYSGFENKVKETLQQRIEAMGMAQDIGEILIPSEEVVEVREGRKKRSTRKFFPGYLLVNMNMTDAAWHVVKNTPKVTGFVGTGTKPVPLQDSEVERIVKQIVVASEKPKPKLEYTVGESVRIVDGPFSNFTGQVEEVNQDRSTLKVMVTIFGRATPVELEFLQVQKP